MLPFVEPFVAIKDFLNPPYTERFPSDESDYFPNTFFFLVF